MQLSTLTLIGAVALSAVPAAPSSQAQPKVVYRDPMHYVAIPATVTMGTMGPTIQKLFPKLFAWAGAHRLTPALAPFLRYDVIDMARQLQIEVAIPVGQGASGDSTVKTGTLPGGRYASLLYTGDYRGLEGANAALQTWAKERGIKFDVAHSRNGDRWGARVEFYLTDPKKQPDPSKWKAEIDYLVAKTGH